MASSNHRSSFPGTSVLYAVRTGDTVASVAAALGATVEELEFLNTGFAATLGETPAGGSIAVTLGVAAEAIGIDNAQVTLAPITLPLGTIAYQVQQADTLAGIATRFGIAGAAALLDGTALADDDRLLKPGAAFTATPPARTSTLGFASSMWRRVKARHMPCSVVVGVRLPGGRQNRMLVM